MNNPLPASIAEIANVIGRDEALCLVASMPRWRGGLAGKESSRVMLYVPKRLTAGHPLVRQLGRPDAQRLVDAFGGECLQPANMAGVARPARDAHIIEDRMRGVPAAVVAKRAGLTTRQVRRIVQSGHTTRGSTTPNRR